MLAPPTAIYTQSRCNHQNSLILLLYFQRFIVVISLEHLETVDAHNKGNDFVDLIATTNMSNLQTQFTRTEE
jgi:hypothetical protein